MNTVGSNNSGPPDKDMNDLRQDIEECYIFGNIIDTDKFLKKEQLVCSNLIEPQFYWRK